MQHCSIQIRNRNWTLNRVSNTSTTNIYHPFKHTFSHVTCKQETLKRNQNKNKMLVTPNMSKNRNRFGFEEKIIIYGILRINKHLRLFKGLSGGQSIVNGRFVLTVMMTIGKDYKIALFYQWKCLLHPKYKIISNGNRNGRNYYYQ